MSYEISQEKTETKIFDWVPSVTSVPSCSKSVSGSSLQVSNSSLLFAIPPEDKRDFHYSLPHEVQKEIVLTLSYLKRIYLADNKARVTRALAALPASKSKCGFSEQSLTRKYYAYINSGGDWHVLVNNVKAPAEKSGLSKAFTEFFKKLCEDNQRCCAGGMRELLVIWRTHHDSKGKEYKSIPGYAEWPEADPRTGVPASWTDRNLYRYAPEEYHLKLGRVGRAAASQYRLKVHKTRFGLRIGEFFQFDDHEYNLKVNFPKQWKAMRPRGFTAVDVLTSMPFAKSFKPTLWDDNEEKKKALTEKDFCWFIIHALCDFGYRNDEKGTALCVEWGTAAIRQAFEERIFNATNGRVRVERGGKFHAEHSGAPKVHSQFRGAVKGNFRFKALIESFWNIIDNYLAAIPGQVGKDRDDAPEQIAGADRYNEKLLKLESALSLSDSNSSLLTPNFRKPFYSWNEFLDAAMACYHAIATTDKHDCEGWEKCGFELKEWRLNEALPWLPYEQYLALPDPQRSVVDTLIHSNQLFHRARRMSRAEAFQKHRRELTPLPAFHWPALMGIENAAQNGDAIAAKSGEFEISDATLQHSDAPLRFIAVDEYGQRLTDKYVCFVNPFNPSLLVACDAKLRVKGICKPNTTVCHNDVRGLQHQMGQAASWESRAIQEFNTRHADDIRAKKEMHEHNARIIAGAPAPAVPAAADVEDCREDL